MSIATLIALVAAVVALLTVAQMAGAARGSLRGDTRQSWWIAAGLALTAVVVLLAQAPLARGLETQIALAVAAGGAAGCVLYLFRYLLRRQLLAGATSLGLGLGLATIAQWIALGEATAASHPRNLDSPAGITAHLERLDERQTALEDRVAHDLPQLQTQLLAQAAEVRAELKNAVGADAAPAHRLRGELREIARLLLALEAEGEQATELIARLRQETRRLERLRGAAVLESDTAALATELDELWQQAGVRLNVPLDRRLGADAIAEVEVDRRFAELLDP
ncbi:MAG: hypothetical protein AAF628_13585 [Planctomycetota bacterium]